MKKLINCFAVSLVLFSSVIWAKSDQLCINQTQTLQPEEINVVEVSRTLPEGLVLDPTLPVTITVEKSICSEGDAFQEFSSLGLPNIPDLPSDGDNRTITQQRGCIVHTYTQSYKGGRWVTTTYKAVYLDNCGVSDV
ncbi:hypothetical protein FCL40_02005 [Ferrimonas sediminicola]|uniref:Uncharacterized protein n=1 Tax=Ferrimonas sediminicola TaxID=2569538 RepID=A0A4U1BKL8_9GAMM|nr:hypothetical protein [Ferrimonas sediminicola]TKB51354.1 hypothetical protein FCL40_02005 [Ferrimonas sediminicola]